MVVNLFQHKISVLYTMSCAAFVKKLNYPKFRQLLKTTHNGVDFKTTIKNKLDIQMNLTNKIIKI